MSWSVSLTFLSCLLAPPEAVVSSFTHGWSDEADLDHTGVLEPVWREDSMLRSGRNQGLENGAPPWKPEQMDRGVCWV